MNTKQWGNYMYELSRAEVVLDEKGENICFNGVKSRRTYFKRLMNLENLLFHEISRQQEESSDREADDRLIRQYILSSEALFAKGDGGWEHERLTVCRNGEVMAFSSLTSRQRLLIREFIRIQHGSIGHLNGLMSREQYLRVGLFRWIPSRTALLELLNALWNTGAVKAVSGSSSRRAFILYIFSLGNISSGSDPDQLISQTLKRRNNSARFLEHLTEQYKRFCNKSPLSK